MGIINYKKIYDQLLREHPHNINAFVKLGEQYEISTEEIINNSKWTAKEKSHLLRSFGYNQQSSTIKNQDKYYCTWEYCIKESNQTGFEALIDIIFNNPEITEEQKLKQCYDILSFITTDAQSKDEAKFIRSLFENIDEELVNKAFLPKYKSIHFEEVRDFNAIRNIIKTKDLDLIKAYLPKVENISLYLSDAVETKNLEIVQYFIQQGADVNYVHEEPVVGYLTPLKVAIKNNDFEMYQLLKNNGANTNLEVQDQNNFEQSILSPKIKIETEKNSDKATYKNASGLKYRRYSLPIEFATDISKFSKGISTSDIFIEFKDESLFEKEYDKIYLYYHSSKHKQKLTNRMLIIDSIYNNIPQEKLKRLNYNNLLKIAIASNSKESFGTYVADIKKLGLEKTIIPEEIIQTYLLFHKSENFIVDEIISFIDHCYPQYNATKAMLESFIELPKDQKYNTGFYSNEFSQYLITKLTEEDKKGLCIVPNCYNLESLKLLLANGFDINQQDKDGNTILINQAKKSPSSEFFQYIIENANSSHKNKENKTALFYALLNPSLFSEEADEYTGAYLPNPMETQIINLIKKMSKEDICDESISDALDVRYYFERKDIKRIFSPESHLSETHIPIHKKLFEALKEKEFTFSDDLIKSTIDSTKRVCRDTKKNVLDVVYGIMDSNNDIQKVSISIRKKEILHALENISIFKQSPATVFNMLAEFDRMVKECKEFEKNSIPNKRYPEKYLEYATDYYGIDYGQIDDWYTEIVVNALVTSESIETARKMLDICTELDINNKVKDKYLNMGYWNYVDQITDIIGVDDDAEPIYGTEHFPIKNLRSKGDASIIFTGGPVQIAILTDNVDLVKELKERGASIDYVTEDGDLTLDYVNSHTMLKLVSELTGKTKHVDLVGEEVDYFNSLIEESETPKKPYQKVKPSPNSKTV